MSGHKTPASGAVADPPPDKDLGESKKNQQNFGPSVSDVAEVIHNRMSSCWSGEFPIDRGVALYAAAEVHRLFIAARSSPDTVPSTSEEMRCWCGEVGTYEQLFEEVRCGGTGLCECGGDNLCCCHNHGECPGCEDCERDDDQMDEDEMP